MTAPGLPGTTCAGNFVVKNSEFCLTIACAPPTLPRKVESPMQTDGSEHFGMSGQMLGADLCSCFILGARSGTGGGAICTTTPLSVI